MNLFFFILSHPPILSFLLQSGMTHQYCCSAYRKWRFDRPEEKQHSSSSWYALLKPSQGTLAAFWWHHSPHTVLPPPSVVRWNKLALTQNGAGISERTRASSERGGAACKQMKREKAHLGEAKGGSLCYDLRLAHTYTQEGETEYCSILLSFAVVCSAAALFYFIIFFYFILFFYNLEQSSQRFIHHRSGFFCAGMGMRDWQVGSRHWRKTLL